MNWPIVAVHMHLLPTGKVMLWPYGDDPRLFDPANSTMITLPRMGENPFCAGHSFLADGRLFVSGGHFGSNGVGINSAYIYNPFSNTWAALPDMNNNRWYPSSTTLPNGDVLVTSGSYDANYSNNDLPQVFQFSNNQWRHLTNARLAMTLYPRTFLAQNGRVFFATQTSRYLNTGGSGAWTTVGSQRVGGRENYGSAAMYDIGKIIYAGGGDAPVASAEIINLNQATPAWQLTGSMSGPRRQNNLTCLPDGTVLCTGGSGSAGFNTDDGPKTAQRWNPATGTWTTLALEGQYRGYHSTALLLPDGRVLSAGGDNHPNAQIFSPPYLFAGTRPTISSAPTTAQYATTISVGTPDATSIAKVALTALGSLTHAQNWNERYVPLAFSRGSGSLNVTIPASGTIVPPGYYLLWIVNSNGVPGVAKFLRVSGGVSGTGTGLTGRYYDNTNFLSLHTTRTDSTVNFNWGSGAPVTGMGADTFTVRWNGDVQAQFTETYTFHTVTDDGVRLWVNGQLIIDKWVNQSAKEWTGTISLSAGQRYAIRMDYYENGGSAVAQLLWSSPSRTKQVIPSTQLYPGP
jgi:hypothetical protein